MTRPRSLIRMTAIASAVVLTASGCAFEGVNSLALPGTVGRGPDATVYHVEVANVGSLESNSPVLVGDVVVGTVGRMSLRGWHADVEVTVKPDVVVPANAVATVGQTSLLGSMHLALNPPVGQSPSGRLTPGSVIGLDNSSSYPSTEQTLSSLSVVANGGGLGQAGDIIREFNAAVNGREGHIRDLLTRLNDFIGIFDSQRDQIIGSIAALDRLSAGFAEQNDVLTAALHRIPPALEVLVKQRPQITTALRELGAFSDTATALIDDTGADLVRNLQNLEPTLRSLGDLGPDRGTRLSEAPTIPKNHN
jgi:virulence factor Mce-like protein